MARTLGDILTSVNSYIALDPTVPTGTDLTTWSDYANQAVKKAASSSVWPQFHSSDVVGISDGTPYATLASISLPSNFREFETAPQVDIGSGTFQQYIEIEPTQRFSKQPNDKYCYVLGNPASGFTAVFNGLAANATLYMDYQRFPSGFATLTDLCELEDDVYVIEQIKSYVLQARSDDRYPSVEAGAQFLLSDMGGRQSRNPQGGVNKTPHQESYRIGE